MSSLTWLLYCSTCYSWGISHRLQLSYHQCIPLYWAQRSLSTTSPHSRDDNPLPALTTSDIPPVMWLLWFYTSQHWSDRPTKFVFKFMLVSSFYCCCKSGPIRCLLCVKERPWKYFLLFCGLSLCYHIMYHSFGRYTHFCQGMVALVLKCDSTILVIDWEAGLLHLFSA